MFPHMEASIGEGVPNCTVPRLGCQLNLQARFWHGLRIQSRSDENPAPRNLSLRRHVESCRFRRSPFSFSLFIGYLAPVALTPSTCLLNRCCTSGEMGKWMPPEDMRRDMPCESGRALDTGDLTISHSLQLHLCK